VSQNSAERLDTLRRQVTYGVKADGLHDLLITTEDRLIPFSPEKPILRTFLLVRPWNRYILELPDFEELLDFEEPPDFAGLPDSAVVPNSADNTQSVEESSVHGSPYILELPDFAQLLDSAEVPDSAQVPDPADGAQGVEYLSVHGSPTDNGPVDSDSYSRALRLIVRLGQPFRALLLAQQRGGEYKRIASDCDIIAEVKDLTSVHNMDLRTPEIL